MELDTYFKSRGTNNSKGNFLLPQPALAWLSIAGLVLITILCAVIRAGTIIRLIFPAGCFAIGILLYLRYPVLYIGFTWWLWIITPWVRRIVDYQSGWVHPNTILLAPYLVTLVSITTAIKHLPRLLQKDSLPFGLSFLAVTHGFLMGLISSLFPSPNKLNLLGKIVSGFRTTASSTITYTLTDVLTGTLDWVAPVIIGCHVFINWQYYPQYRQNIQRVFFWTMAISGIYGVIQYLIAPQWDRFWLENVIELGADSFGSPEPLGIRIFSTMNSPGSFARFMIAGLLLMFTGKGNWRWFSAPFAYLAFLLSLVRSAWGGWFLGLLIFSTSVKPRLQVRLLIMIVVIILCALPLTTIEPFSEVIQDRLETFTNIQEDGSLEARTETYSKVFNIALLEIFGNGFGLPGMDSSLIDIFIAMGWIGALPYIIGLFLIVFKLISFNDPLADPFFSASKAISLCLIAGFTFGNPFTAVEGVLIWFFLGIAFAGQKYNSRAKYLHKM